MSRESLSADAQAGRDFLGLLFGEDLGRFDQMHPLQPADLEFLVTLRRKNVARKDTSLRIRVQCHECRDEIWTVFKGRKATKFHCEDCADDEGTSSAPPSAAGRNKYSRDRERKGRARSGDI